MKDQRTPLFAKQPNGRYKFTAYLDDMRVAPTYADGLWLFQHHDSGQSAAHICALDDLSTDALSVAKAYAHRDAVWKLINEKGAGSNYDLATRIVRLIAKG